MSFESLNAQYNGKWTAILNARRAADDKVAEIDGIIKESAGLNGKFDDADMALVVFGSLARAEWTTGSDLDWTLLIDGIADHSHARIAHAIGKALEKNGFKEPGRTGTFGKLVFSHNLIHQIGGGDDSNRNTTQRLLLLLESRDAINSAARNRVVRGIISRYLENDYRGYRFKVPRFLMNDLHRYWRTMCVDYASKYVDRGGDGWAIRNIKLRMSRKLIFATGMISCYSCDNSIYGKSNADLSINTPVEQAADYLFKLVQKKPLDIMCDALEPWADNVTIDQILDSYNYFLEKMNDKPTRDHLEALDPEKSEGDELFQDLIEKTRTFEKGLEQLFFGGPFADLNRKYGVF